MKQRSHNLPLEEMHARLCQEPPPAFSSCPCPTGRSLLNHKARNGTCTTHLSGNLVPTTDFLLIFPDKHVRTWKLRLLDLTHLMCLLTETGHEGRASESQNRFQSSVAVVSSLVFLTGNVFKVQDQYTLANILFCQRETLKTHPSTAYYYYYLMGVMLFNV